MIPLRHTVALVLAGLFAHATASTPTAAPAQGTEDKPVPVAEHAAAPDTAPETAAAEADPTPPAPEPAKDASPDELAKSMLVLAQHSMKRGDSDAAETAYVEALNTPSSDAITQEALLAYADFLRKTARNTRAAAIYEKFLATYPAAPNALQVLIELGRTLREMGAFGLAQVRFYAVLNSTLSVSPENIQRYRDLAQLAKFEIAETYYQQGDFASAGKFFGRIKLLELPPAERARASFREAYAFYLDGKLDQAVPALRNYLDTYPQHLSAQEGRYLLCMSLRRLGLTQEALAETLTLLRSAQAAAEADRERWTYWQRRTGNQLANDFYEQGDFTAALTIYRTLSELRSDPAWRWPALYQVGLCYERLRQTDRAATAYRDILTESAAGEKAGPSTDGTAGEVRRMAEWRLGQIAWVGTIESTMRSYSAQQLPPNPAASKVR